MKEVWKDIKNYEGLYQVSNLGRVRSLDRYIETFIKNQIGRYKCTKFYKGYILKQQTYQGYKCVQIHTNGQYKWEKVHRLVAETFIPNSNNLPQVNHIDGNKENNKVDNLEWCTHSENIKHAYNNNLINHYKRKIKQYDLQGNFIQSYSSIIEASKNSNVSNSQIYNVIIGKLKQTGGFVYRKAA